MLSLHVKLENEYLKLNDFIQDGNITWGKNGDDGVSVNLKNVPNGKNLLADALGREIVAYRGGELAWKGFVNNITENENGIELVGRGDFHRLEYIEDFNEIFSASSFDRWMEVTPENSKYYPSLTMTTGLQVWIDADVQGAPVDSVVYTLNSKVGSRSYKLDQYVTGAPARKVYGVDSSHVEMFTYIDNNKFKSSYVTTSGIVSMFAVIDNTKSVQSFGTIIDMGTNSNGFRLGLNRSTTSSSFTTEAYYTDDLQSEFIYISPRYDSSGNVVTGGWPYSYEGPIYNEFGDELSANSALYLEDGTPLAPLGEYDVYPRITFKSSGAFLQSSQKLSNGINIVFVTFNRSTNAVSIQVNNGTATTGTRTVGTAPTTESCIAGTYSTNPYGNGDSNYKMSEFLLYNGAITGNDYTSVYTYLDNKYNGTTHKFNPNDFYDLILTPRGTVINKIETDFENRAYMTIPNGSTFSMGDSAILVFKVPDTVTTDMLFNFAEFEYNIPPSFVLNIYAYAEDGTILNLKGIENSYIYPDITGTNVDFANFSTDYTSNKKIKQIMISLTFPGYNDYDSTTPFYSFTNTQSDNFYYVNVKYFRSQIDPFIGRVKGTVRNAKTFDILGYGNVPAVYDPLTATEPIRDFIVYTSNTTPVYQGNLIYFLEDTEEIARGLFRVKRVDDSTYLGSPAKAVYIDLPPDYYNIIFVVYVNPYTKFNIVQLPTSEVVKYIIETYLPNYPKSIIYTEDDLSNLNFENTSALNAVKQLTENLDFRFYVTGGKVFFVNEPLQTYYLMQNSKNVSQSFDKVYTDVRTKYTSIYQFSSVTNYARPSEKYDIVRSKTLEQGTLSRSLANIVAETVAREDVGSAVKVTPQTGELYNEYGAVVRDPKINSAVVLKNVVPELIGLGEKTYYLSEIKYDFTTGQYEYVIDEPEITFESILGKVQSGN